MTVRRALILLFVLLILVGLAYMQFRTWRHFQWNIFLEKTAEADPWYLLEGVGLIYLTYILRARRWKVFLRPLNKVATSASIIPPTFIGFAGIAILGRPGDLIRPFLISRKENVSFPSQIAILAVERIFDIGCFTLLLVLDVFLSPEIRHGHEFRGFRVAGYLLILLVTGIILGTMAVWKNAPGVASWFERMLKPASPETARNACEKIQRFGEGLHTIHDAASFFEIFGLSTLIWFIIAVAYRQVTHAYPGHLQHMTIAHVLLVMSASIAGSLLQLPVVGGGSQLGTITVLDFLLRHGRDVSDPAIDAQIKASAASCGIMLWLVTFMAVLPVGIALARHARISFRRLEQETHAEAD
jgi:uncharacterized protein (TIRG00374 family)